MSITQASLKGECLGQASQGHEMHCHDLGIVGSNPGWVENYAHIEPLCEPYLNLKSIVLHHFHTWRVFALKV